MGKYVLNTICIIKLFFLVINKLYRNIIIIQIMKLLYYDSLSVLFYMYNLTFSYSDTCE